MQSAKQRYRNDAAEPQADESQILMPVIAPGNPLSGKPGRSPAPSSPQIKAARAASTFGVASCLTLAWAVLATTVAAISIALHVAQPPPWITAALQSSGFGSTDGVRIEYSGEECRDWISKPSVGGDAGNAGDPWASSKWMPRMSPCPVAGLPIEELDEHLNFRRGYVLGFVDDAEDKTQILPTLRAVLDPALSTKKRRVLIDLGARFFNTSVTWFLQSYPLDFTEIHAVEVRQGVFEVPAAGNKTVRGEMNHRSRLRPIGKGPADFPAWLLARVHSHRFKAAAWDKAAQNVVNVTRWLLEELKLTPEDSVVVKMDIEGAEWDIFKAWLESPIMPRVIDELFVEIHYNHPSMAYFSWNPKMFAHSRQEAGQLLNQLRTAGYYVHAWP
ncbi:hypothetical protein CLOM_g16534 [Closterium sp. NIES-68]|nr:hypothetical protein CLOM_g16534 [Closterium sp. NIES-68]GJP58475.1 hypothetical protein CLOP_g79 [Closterium sp. NIES-67]